MYVCMHVCTYACTVKAGKLKDGLPRLVHGARHLPTLSLAVYVTFVPSSCLPTLVHKMQSRRYCRIQKHAQHFCFKRWRDSETAAGTAESLSTKYWQFQDPPYCIQNHAQNASPQVLAGFSGIAFPQVLAVPKHSHNHAHDAFPQLLAGVRNGPGHGGIAFTSYNTGISRTHRTASRTTPKMLCPKY